MGIGMGTVLSPWPKALGCMSIPSQLQRAELTGVGLLWLLMAPKMWPNPTRPHVWDLCPCSAPGMEGIGSRGSEGPRMGSKEQNVHL